MFVIPIYAFISLFLKAKHSILKKLQAVRYYAGIVIIPIILYALFFFALIGIEELSQIQLVTEGLARTFVVVIGMGLIIWFVSLIAFSVTLVFLQSQTSPPNTRDERGAPHSGR